MADEKKTKFTDHEIDKDIKSIDPTKLGGLDSNMPDDLDPEIMTWAKSRGKKKK